MAKLILDGDAKGAVHAHEDVNKAVAKTKAHYKELGDESEKAGQKHKESFGERSVADLGKYVAGLATVEKAIELVVKGFEEVKKESTDAAARAAAALVKAGELAGVSGTPAGFKANLAMARSISATGIADDTQSAAIVAAWQKAH